MRYKVITVILISLLFVACGSDRGADNSSESKKTVEMTKGQQLFNNYCLQCHSLVKDKLGPNLKGAFARWDYDTARISAFIRNAQDVINMGDPRAIEVAKEWNHALMTPMPHLSDEDIKALLEYMAE